MFLNQTCTNTFPVIKYLSIHDSFLLFSPTARYFPIAFFKNSQNLTKILDQKTIIVNVNRSAISARFTDRCNCHMMPGVDIALEWTLSHNKLIIYYIKLQFSLSVCLSVPPSFFFDTTVGPQPNLAHIFGLIWDSFSAKKI